MILQLERCSTESYLFTILLGLEWMAGIPTDARPHAGLPSHKVGNWAICLPLSTRISERSRWKQHHFKSYYIFTSCYLLL